MIDYSGELQGNLQTHMRLSVVLGLHLQSYMCKDSCADQLKFYTNIMLHVQSRIKYCMQCLWNVVIMLQL